MGKTRKTGFFNGYRWNPFTRFIDMVTSLSYQTLLTLWVSLAIGFGVLYFVLGHWPGHGPEQIEGMAALERFWNALYYSVITATSTGYGDITPMGISKMLASLQSILALFIFAVFVTKLVSRRQDIALRQIHKLAFEDVFHNIREGFHIVRKDWDRLIMKAGMEHKLDERDWEDLVTSYRQAQTFLRRIPDFYDAENRIYRIDVRREELLQDGLKRTLKGIIHLLEVLRSKHVNWVENNTSLEELREFVQLVRKIVHFWQIQSPHGKNEGFEELFDLNEEIHRTLESAVEHTKHHSQ